MAKIYQKDGWLNWDYLIGQGAAFNMIVGARGVGKTYGFMKYCLNHGRKFIYLRRLKSQLDQCSTADGNPFKRINNDLERDIVAKSTKGGVIFSEADNIIAVGVALSTVANVRGFDYSDYDLILFDEAIASDGERPIPNEFNAFLNFYETVNRNRELLGEKPVQVFLLGNANRLTNPYFIGWRFMKTALNMIKGKQMVWKSSDKTRMMVMLCDSDISARKAQTVLYKNTSRDYNIMALDNAFRIDSTNIKSMPIKEFNHIVTVGEIAIYKHKRERVYYVSFLTNPNKMYDSYGISLKMFQQDFYDLRLFYLVYKNVFFENYEAELIFRELIGLT